jgi:two-component system sensor histidine kinase QseC
MTLRRRLLLLLLATAPLLWLAMLVLTLLVTRKEVDELFDTRQVKMAQQLLVLLPDDPAALPARAAPLPAPGTDLGAADLEDMALSVAAANGSLLLADREGQRLPRDAPPGFQTTDIGGEEWRIYTLVSSDGRWRITVGQLTEERAELTWDVMASQSMTMLLGLALLVAGMTWAVRSALQPVERMRHALLARPADDLRPVQVADVPADLQPLVQSINTLLARVGELLAHERQLIADAAHELRTPLAALRAQWEAAQAADANAGSGDRIATREHAARQVGLGIERLTRLVNQLLALARVEGESGAQAARGGPVDWQRVVQDALSDCLPLIDATGAEIDVRWPPAGTAPLPLVGNEALLTTLLRNLIDNALRYGGAGTQVRLDIGADALVIDDSGPGASAAVLARMGDRFYRGASAAASGSGLGLSIVKRIARLHGLEVSLQSPPPGQAQGLRATLRRVVS